MAGPARSRGRSRHRVRCRGWLDAMDLALGAHPDHAAFVVGAPYILEVGRRDPGLRQPCALGDKADSLRGALGQAAAIRARRVLRLGALAERSVDVTGIIE